MPRKAAYRRLSILGFALSVGSTSIWLSVRVTSDTNLLPTYAHYAMYGSLVGACTGLMAATGLGGSQDKPDRLIQLLGLCAGLITIVLLFAAFAAMFGPAGLLLFLTLLQVPTLRRSFRDWRTRQYADFHSHRRAEIYHELATLVYLLPQVLVLVFFWRDPFRFLNGQTLTAANIGIKSTVHPVACFALGYFVVPVYAGLRRLLETRMPTNEALVTSRSLVFIRAGTPRGRTAIFLNRVRVIIFIPIWEELVMRGCFIHYLDQTIGSLPIAIAFGLTLFLLAHFYQGLEMIPVGVLFFAFLVGLLCSPLGLVAAIGLHVGWNYRFVNGLPHSAEEYHAIRARARRN